MAGCHQIWKMRLDGSSIGPYAGNGREDIVDGPLLPRQPYEPGFASFAQPSGLAGDGTWLYVADSEGSSIRAVPLTARGGGPHGRRHVATAGRPAVYLRRRGRPAAQARFQHPLGLAFHDGRIYVADTLQPQDPRRRSDGRNHADTGRHGSGAGAVRRSAGRRFSSRPGWPWRQASSSWPTRTITCIRAIDLKSCRYRRWRSPV